jgi:predicted AAA+ superfamily ATPase
MPALYYYRDSHGNEVDLLVPEGRTLHAAEIKSAHTFSDRLLQGLRKFRAQSGCTGRTMLIYNGERCKLSDGVEAVPFGQASRLIG